MEEGSAPAPPPSEETESRYGDLRIGAAFSETALEGEAGGPYLATDLDPTCIGRVFTEPNHRLVVDELQALTLSASPDGRGIMDLALLIRDPSGAFACADDALTLDPVHAGMFEPGTYDVWVSARADYLLPYTLRVQAGNHAPDPIVLGGRFPAPVDEGPAPERTTEGTFGGLRMAEGTGLARLTGQAAGTREASSLLALCSGVVSEVPDHVIELAAPTELQLRVRAEGDTVLVVQGPRRVWCTDDDEGLDPVLREPFEPGTYSVYVGTYAADEEIPYRLTVSR